MAGEFVTANCMGCGAGNTLSEIEFRGLGVLVVCPQCKNPMTAEFVPGSSGKPVNYG